MRQDESDLTEAGLDEAQLDVIRQQHSHLRSEGKSSDLATLAIRSRFISAEQLQAGESNQIGKGDFLTVQAILSLDVCRRFFIVPVEYSKGILTIKCSQPLNEAQKNRIQSLLRSPVQSLKFIPASVQEVLLGIHGIEQSGSVGGLITTLKQEGIEAGRLRALVFAILKEALTLRSSDIHITKKPDPDAWIAYRIDSIIRQSHLLPEGLMQSLVARIKIESGMDASNSRTAQDGRLSIDFQGRSVDFRISTQPLVDGESLVMRALDASLLPSLNSLFPAQPRMMYLIHSITRQSGKTGGLVFISGATGSGKSTTQYTMACGFRRDAMNVITVEDPVEYVLPFAKQIQLQALLKQRAIELERSILRQDPDILIFGEIRDADSARAALAFAESGHLVISTIHANSAVQVVERFLSMIDPDHRADSEFLIAHYLRLVIHQKLMRKLCVCAKNPSKSELEQLKQEADLLTGGLIKINKGIKVAVGCSRCSGTGYLGRVAAHETMHVPAEEPMRSRFVRAFKSGNIELPADLNERNGIEFISRLLTLQTLLNEGLMDWASISKSLGGA